MPSNSFLNFTVDFAITSGEPGPIAPAANLVSHFQLPSIGFMNASSSADGFGMAGGGGGRGPQRRAQPAAGLAAGAAAGAAAAGLAAGAAAGAGGGRGGRFGGGSLGNGGCGSGGCRSRLGRRRLRRSRACGSGQQDGCDRDLGLGHGGHGSLLK